MTVNIDLSGVTAPKEFHERVRQALDLPDWYGNNLDALYDVLSVRTELSVRFLNASQLRTASSRYAAALERMCVDLSSETQGRSCTVESRKIVRGETEEPDEEEPDRPAPETTALTEL